MDRGGIKEAWKADSLPGSTEHARVLSGIGLLVAPAAHHPTAAALAGAVAVAHAEAARLARLHPVEHLLRNDAIGSRGLEGLAVRVLQQGGDLVGAEAEVQGDLVGRL